MSDIVSVVITDRRNQLILCLVLGFITFIAGFNQSSIASILPEISDYFQLDVGDVAWITIIYQLFMSGPILVFGKICDKGAMKNVLMFGIVSFIVGSILCIIFDSFAMMLVGRAIQGIGASTIWCCCVMLGVKHLPKNLIAFAMVAITVGETLGWILGPLLCGLVSPFLHWEWVFIMDVVIGLAVLPMIYRVIPKDEPQDFSDFDYRGALYLTVAIVSGTYCLETTTSNGFDYVSATLIPVFLITLALFIRRCIRVKDPIVKPSLFKSSTANKLTGLYIIELLVIDSFIYVMPIFSVVALGQGSTEKGLMMFLPPLMACILSFVVCRYFSKFKSKYFMYLTCIAIIASSVAFVLIDTSPMFLSLFILVTSGLLWALGEIVIVSSIVNCAQDSERCAMSVMNSYIANFTDAIAVVVVSKIFLFGSGTKDIVVSEMTHSALMGGVLLVGAVCLVLGAIAVALVLRTNSEMIDSTLEELDAD